MIKLNGLGHVGGCGCGSCSGCSVPSQLSGEAPVSALFQGPGRGEPVAAQIGRQGATVGGLMALAGLFYIWRYGQ